MIKRCKTISMKFGTIPFLRIDHRQISKISKFVIMSMVLRKKNENKKS